MASETIYITPSGERVRVVDTASAAEHLIDMLTRFRSGEHEPLFFGDSGQPEGVVISWDEWRRLIDDDYIYDVARERLKSNEPSVPLEDVAAEMGWDLNEDLDDPGRPKS